jgi:hypothetical protein
VSLFFSEADAQALSTQLRARAPVGTILTGLKAGLSRRLGTLLSGVPSRSVRIIHEAVPTEQFRSPLIGGALKLVGRPLGGVLIKWLLEALKRELEQRADQFAGHFTRAAAADADGVTVSIVFRQPSFMAPLRKLLAGGSPIAAATMGASLLRQAMSEYNLVIHPGFVRSSRQAWQPVSKT